MSAAVRNALPTLSRGRSLVIFPNCTQVQAIFVVLLLLDWVLRVPARGDLDLVSVPVLAVVAAVALLLMCVVARSLPPYAFEAMLLADLAVIGAVRLDPQGAGAGLLVVYPALWLGRLLGRRGAWVTALASVVLVALPSLVVYGSDGSALSRAVLLPIVAGFAAFAISDGMQEAATRQDEAGQREVELAQARDTIEHQRRVSDAIMESVDIGLVLLDRAGKYAGINRQHETFMRLAYPDGHAGQAGQTGYVWAEDGVSLLRTVDTPTYRAFHGEEFDDRRIWVGREPRERRALSVSARTVRDGDGKVAGAALAYKDVTDFMRALEVKDQFVASVSHELRTPLTSILGYVQLIVDRDDMPRETLDQLAVVERNAERLRSLITDLLDSAQLEGGAMAVLRTPGDLVRIVRDSVQAVAPAARAAGIDIQVFAPPELVLPVDAQRIAQVVDNLLSNAVKYTPSGGSVEVRLTRDTQRAQLEVCDTGFGIAAADRDLLFTRFYRAPDAEHRTIPGVGLGLAISKGIVEAHGGRIEVDSEPGRGSVFRVRLPLATGP